MSVFKFVDRANTTGASPNICRLFWQISCIEINLLAFFSLSLPLEITESRLNLNNQTFIELLLSQQQTKNMKRQCDDDIAHSAHCLWDEYTWKKQPPNEISHCQKNIRFGCMSLSCCWLTNWLSTFDCLSRIDLCMWIRYSTALGGLFALLFLWFIIILSHRIQSE